MNDASGARDPADFANRVRAIAERILVKRPACDVMLISSMTANPEWAFAAPDLYPRYAEALTALRGPRMAVADVTSVWRAVDGRKKHLDLTGNGLNHPNDWGHRLYADVVLKTIDNSIPLRAFARIRDFAFPWSDAEAPRTEFEGGSVDDRFHFTFTVDDADIVVSDAWDGESTVDGEDRVELFFARDAAMGDYYCIEIDPAGRVHDYRASHYRKFDSDWSCDGLQVESRRTETGYRIRGSIPFQSLSRMLDRPVEPGSTVLLGLFRAEFSRRPGALGESNGNWISWARPQADKPDFHVPSALRPFWIP